MIFLSYHSKKKDYYIRYLVFEVTNRTPRQSKSKLLRRGVICYFTIPFVRIYHLIEFDYYQAGRICRMFVPLIDTKILNQKIIC